MPDPSHRHTWVIRAAALTLSLSAPAAATETVIALPDTAAQRVAEAEALAEQAYAAYVARDFARAVALYHEAFERAPSADALFNIARIYDVGLRDRALAISFYRRYLSDPGAAPERIQRANVRLAELRQAEHAELAAPAPVVAAPRPTRTTARAHDTDGMSGWQIAGLATGAVGVVAAGLGAVYGVTVVSDAERANRDCEGTVCRSQQGIDAARRASRNAPLATWGVVGGAGLIAGGALLWLLAPAREEAPPSDVRLDPVASAGELGLALSGRW